MLQANEFEYQFGVFAILRNDIDMLEDQKTKHILILNRRIDEFQETLNNSSKFSQSNASWYSVDISYTPPDSSSVGENWP